MNRGDLPNFQASKLSQHEQISFYAEILLALRWKNKRNVHMIPTISGTEMITNEKIDHQTGRRILKLISVKDYNENKWLIDKSHMHMPFSKCLRKSFNW